MAVDWARRSPQGRAILRIVAIPISEGCSPTEIARELGTSRNWVLHRIELLCDELERLALPR